MLTKYTCGKCGRVVFTTPPSDNVSLDRMIADVSVADRLIATALFCPKCDDIVCIGCGTLKMSVAGVIPCGKCGCEEARTLDESNHPSWYPGQRPIK